LLSWRCAGWGPHAFFSKKKAIYLRNALLLLWRCAGWGPFFLLEKDFWGGSRVTSDPSTIFFCLKKIFLESHGSWLFSFKKKAAINMCRGARGEEITLSINLYVCWVVIMFFNLFSVLSMDSITEFFPGCC